MVIAVPFVYTFGVVYDRLPGGVLLTVITTLAVALPMKLVALTIYVAVAEIAVGVPLITPVVLFNTRPAGNSGSTV